MRKNEQRKRRLRMLFFCMEIILLMMSTQQLIQNRFLEKEALIPQRCRICDYPPRHAPCVVQLESGEVCEMRIYQPDISRPGEIAEYQPTGFVSFWNRAGIIFDASPSEGFCKAFVPSQNNCINKELFCERCREILQLAVNQQKYSGYALVDLYVPENLHAFPMGPGQTVFIRQYTVRMQQEESAMELRADFVGQIRK